MPKRVVQMTHKTNQFNLTTKRLHAIPEGVDTYVTLVSDKYGDYGLVGVSFVRETEEVLTLALTLSPNPNLSLTLIRTLTRTRTRTLVLRLPLTRSSSSRTC